MTNKNGIRNLDGHSFERRTILAHNKHTTLVIESHDAHGTRMPDHLVGGPVPVGQFDVDGVNFEQATFETARRAENSLADRGILEVLYQLSHALRPLMARAPMSRRMNLPSQSMRSHAS